MTSFIITYHTNEEICNTLASSVQYQLVNAVDTAGHTKRSVEKPELGRYETARPASGSKRTSATDIQCSRILAAPKAHNATSLGPTDCKLCTQCIYCHVQTYTETNKQMSCNYYTFPSIFTDSPTYP